mmetsp:Transcript_130426/g.260221  ORF Transcript_130426/g.260221 Transcript_130426/m.260221 type:complete len:219 (+) Transcript_130426:1295-1951(+)
MEKCCQQTVSGSASTFCNLILLPLKFAPCFSSKTWIAASRASSVLKTAKAQLVLHKPCTSSSKALASSGAPRGMSTTPPPCSAVPLPPSTAASLLLPLPLLAGKASASRKSWSQGPKIFHLSPCGCPCGCTCVAASEPCCGCCVAASVCAMLSSNACITVSSWSLKSQQTDTPTTSWPDSRASNSFKIDSTGCCPWRRGRPTTRAMKSFMVVWLSSVW